MYKLVNVSLDFAPIIVERFCGPPQPVLYEVLRLNSSEPSWVTDRKAPVNQLLITRAPELVQLRLRYYAR